MSKHPFKVGDIITRDNNYFGLIVSERYDNLNSIYLSILNTSNHVRQLNLLFSESNNYSYKVISL
jgi:hypothetical protein